MQSSLRVGRVGPLSIYLNYTWLFAIVLGLWWLALLWLPDNYHGWGGALYWIVAVVVLFLYICSVLFHEFVHTVVARSGPRNVTLFPFGAAMPFRLHTVDAGRGVIAALAAPVANILLGGVLVIAASLINSPEDPGGLLQAVLLPLGWLNIALGVINFIPGIPFDGGWAWTAAAMWFGTDREAGLRLARPVGEFTALALVLAGAWRGLTTNSWLEALCLVLIGWAAREGAAVSSQRVFLREAFGEVHASDLMEPAHPAGAVTPDTTLSTLSRSHRTLSPNTPIPVVDDTGSTIGTVTMADLDTVLQGNWATTPVRAITRPLSEEHYATPEAPLTALLAVAARRQSASDSAEEQAIPVMSGGRLVGSIDPQRLAAFNAVGERFGVDEAVDASRTRRGLAGALGALLPAIMLVAALAVLGHLALRTNPAELRELTADTAAAPITFTTYVPADDSIIGAGPLDLSVQVIGPSAITTATMTLDGDPLEVEMSGSSPLTQTITAQIPGLTQGIHNIAVTVGTESGRSRRTEWQFRVSFLGGATEQTPGPSSTGAPLKIVDYSPNLAARLLAGSTAVPLIVQVSGNQPPSQAIVTLDGTQLDASMDNGALEGNYTVSAEIPTLPPGNHRVRVEIEGGSGGFYSTEWTFSALVPDEANVYYEQTGVFLSDPFLSYWRDNGGLALFGYPISDRVQETTPQGEVYTAKYFERARMEIQEATGNKVILGRLGAAVHPSDPPAKQVDGAQFFSETGHNLAGAFLDYWNANGGLAVFGYPISEEITERNPVDGKEYRVQYFERNRFEYHPEFAGTPSEVQLGLLGSQIYSEKYGK
jgi:Zn-dependent protease